MVARQMLAKLRLHCPNDDDDDDDGYWFAIWSQANFWR